LESLAEERVLNTEIGQHWAMKMNIKFYICFIPLTLAWVVSNPSLAATPTNPKILHLLNRLSFGPQPGDIDKTASMGVERYIQQQLNPTAIPEPQALTDQLSELDTVKLTSLQLLEQNQLLRSQKGQKPTPEERKAYRQQMRLAMEQSVQARLLRATKSPRQLQEEMVDFWYNHFNVFSGKGVVRLLAGAYEQEAIRPHTLGRFRDLIEATARHPAMLFYLDNWQNSAPNGSSASTPKARGKSKGLNENYARELMELHTLGVDGGYTQKDVVALAKILTGWTFRRSAQPGVDPYGFYFDAKRHDSSDKVFMGHVIKGSGMAEGEQAFDILAKSPATARHISYQLAQYFVADQPPKPLVNRLAQKFLATDGNIREVLNTLFHSPEFWDNRVYNAKFKTPYQYALSALRATGTEPTNFRPVYGFLQQLGMPLYGCLTPDGYKNTEAVWLNPDAMTRRISFATALTSGKLPLATMTPLDATQLSTTLGNPFSAKTQRAIATSPPQLRPALILGSPEFMRR
jgi:uncharacterized protein (DUF1800 family)